MFLGQKRKGILYVLQVEYRVKGAAPHRDAETSGDVIQFSVSVMGNIV